MSRGRSRPLFSRHQALLQLMRTLYALEVYRHPDFQRSRLWLRDVYPGSLIHPPHEIPGETKTYTRAQIGKITAYIQGDVDHLDFFDGPPRTWQEIHGKAVIDKRVAEQIGVPISERVRYVQAIKSLAMTYFPGAPLDPSLYYPSGLIDQLMILEIDDLVMPSGAPTYMLTGGIETLDREWAAYVGSQDFTKETGWGSSRIKIPRWQDWRKVAGWVLTYVTAPKGSSILSISIAIASEAGSKNTQSYIEQQIRRACLLLQLRPNHG